MRCDGLVVATPQGSTGYNLANGGPVLAWGVEGYVVSFIAPHSLTARALVVAPGDVLTINNASREEPVEVARRRPPDLRAAARARTSTSSSARAHGTLAQLPGRELLPPPARALRPARARSAASSRTHCRIDSARSGERGHPSAAAGRPSGVLHELRVENLLLIERAELRLGPGLNVLTGETGAGKTVLAHALDLLLGGKPRPGHRAARARRRRTSRACSRCRDGAARRRSATACPRTPRSSCSPAA